MTHLSSEKLQRAADALVTTPTWAKAMAAIGASEQLAYVWLAKSRAAQRASDESSPFFVEWRGVTDYWHCHCGRARRESLVRYEAIVRDQVANGIEVPVLDAAGQYVYKLNPLYMGWSDADMRDVLGLDPRTDRYLKDDKGNPIVQTRIEQVPATLRAKVLETMPDYQPTVNHNIKSRSVVKVIPLRPLPQLRKPDGSRLDLEELRRLAQLPPRNPRPTHPIERFAPNDSAPDRTSTYPAEDALEAPRPSYARPPRSPSPSPTDNPLGRRVERADHCDVRADYIGRGDPGPGGRSVVR